MSNVVHLSVVDGVPGDSYWDLTMLHDLLDGMPDSERTVVIIPGAYQGNAIDKINLRLKDYSKVLVFITSDEEGKFKCAELSHPDMIHYHQYGYCDKLFPIGYTSETRKNLKRIGLVDKDINIFFAGQLNSDERREKFAKAAFIKNSVLFGTDGFAKGLKPEEYYEYMASAKSVLAPGGHISPDSFRFYEALEAGAWPIEFNRNYMMQLFPDFPPFFKAPVTQQESNEIFAWWIAKKQEFKRQFKKDLNINEAMTIVVPTSPIPSHPSTEIIEQTIASIRHHTGMDIIITIDGIRPEQEDRRADYNEYIRKLLWKCNFEWENVTPILFKEHVHQSGMMKKALEIITTPLILYVEHDTPLVIDEEIDWSMICETLLRGDANVVRFHYEAHIPEVHEYLMEHDKDIPFFTATRQWSQRPHVARTILYKEVMKFFSEDSNCFIEDRLYGQAVEAPWDDWKIYIYTPPGNIKRSLNLDGRADDRKFEAEQKW